MPRQSFSVHRRHRLANSLLSKGFITMRPCSACTRAGILCVTFSESESCEQCVRFHRSYELAWPAAEIERLHKADDELLSKMAEIRRKAQEADAALFRLRKQRRALQKRLRSIGDRELENILNLEINELLSNRQLPTLKALNSPSPRPSSFTALIGGERFINPFLRLLDSPNRNAEMS
jgi:hypothetical protein